MSKVILVGVDEHEVARDAVSLGATLAKALHDELVLLHVYPFDPLAGGRGLGARPEDPLRAKAAQIVECSAQGLSVMARQMVAPYPSIGAGLHSEAAREGADVLVVGSTHRSALGRVALTTHTGRALHGAPCAVAVAPRGLADSSWKVRSIGVGYDGSDEADEALAFARRLAASTGAGLRLFAVAETLPDGWGSYVYRPDWRGYAERMRDDAARMLQAIAADGEQTEVREGDPVTELLALSGQVDLLVLGSRRYGAARRAVLGSTSDGVARRDAGCPVVVVPRRVDPAGDTSPDVAVHAVA